MTWQERVCEKLLYSSTSLAGTGVLLNELVEQIGEEGISQKTLFFQFDALISTIRVNAMLIADIQELLDDSNISIIPKGVTA